MCVHIVRTCVHIDRDVPARHEIEATRATIHELPIETFCCMLAAGDERCCLSRNCVAAYGMHNMNAWYACII